MRDDMARVIVERPRIKPYNTRKGRRVAFEDMPSRMGMRRGWALLGDTKSFNENLAPLRRYLERQVGRPWNKVYSEIADRLRVSSTVQQHVRDHLRDVVMVDVTRRDGRSWFAPDLWWQALYVDPQTGLLCRTDRLRRKGLTRCDILAGPRKGVARKRGPYLSEDRTECGRR